MKDKKPWASALNVAPETYATWELETPKGQSLTFYCLERGKIRANDYLSWAKDFYGLPALDSSYFQMAANRDFWRQIKPVANWSAELMPLEMWDGVVFVACVEPPSSIKWSFPVQYVLAQPRDLKALYDRLEDEPTIMSASVILPSPSMLMSPQTVVQTADRTHLSEPPPAASPAPIITPNASSHELNPASHAEVPSDDRAPLSSRGDSFSMDSLETSIRDQVQLTPTTSKGVSAPEGLSLESLESPWHQDEKTIVGTEPSNRTGLDAPEGLNLHLKSFPPPPPKIPPPISARQKDSPPAAAPAKIHRSLTTEAVDTSTSGPSLKEAPTPRREPAPAIESAIKDPKHKARELDSDRLAPASFEHAKTTDEAMAWVFQQMKMHFAHSWFLHAQGENLAANCWDSSVHPKSSYSLEPISLKEPSLFRIVVRTRMPYHGHVVENPINTSFFKYWGLRATPEHVTAVPVLSQDQLVGVLMGAGSKEANTDQVLKTLERLATSATRALMMKAAA